MTTHGRLKYTGGVYICSTTVTLNCVEPGRHGTWLMPGRFSFMLSNVFLFSAHVTEKATESISNGKMYDKNNAAFVIV